MKTIQVNVWTPRTHDRAPRFIKKSVKNLWKIQILKVTKPAMKRIQVIIWPPTADGRRDGWRDGGTERWTDGSVGEKHKCIVMRIDEDSSAYSESFKRVDGRTDGRTDRQGTPLNFVEEGIIICTSFNGLIHHIIKIAINHTEIILCASKLHVFNLVLKFCPD